MLNVEVEGTGGEGAEEDENTLLQFICRALFIVFESLNEIKLVASVGQH